MFYFTSDEHYGHKKIIEYCNRPYSNIEEMDNALIENFNSVVSPKDITVHAGDFCWLNNKQNVYETYVKKLNGSHIFLVGSHDHWQPDSAKFVWSSTIDKQFVIACHYCFRTWERSHYNSWQLFGHSHGRLTVDAKQYDIGVDNNNYFPVSFDQIKVIMINKPDNPNYVKKEINE